MSKPWIVFIVIVITVITYFGAKEQAKDRAERRAEKVEYLKRCFSKPAVVRVGPFNIPLRLKKSRCK
jgi:hypothetical protein